MQTPIPNQLSMLSKQQPSTVVLVNIRPSWWIVLLTIKWLFFFTGCFTYFNSSFCCWIVCFYFSPITQFPDSTLFNWRKIFILMKNRHHHYWIIGLTKHLQKKLVKFSDISFALNHAWNRKTRVNFLLTYLNRNSCFNWLCWLKRNIILKT